MYNTHKGLLDTFEPITERSSSWKRWVTHIGPHTCAFCFAQNGTIMPINEDTSNIIPVHPNCTCETVELPSIRAGGATYDGENGADYWLKHYGKLPNYYVSREEFEKAGWKSGKPPRRYLPDKMIFGGIFNNREGKLPVALGRIWYEADINYYEGRRNQHRIYFSNDGLIFVSYDHGRTDFYEII